MKKKTIFTTATSSQFFSGQVFVLCGCAQNLEYMPREGQSNKYQNMKCQLWVLWLLG